MRLIIFSLVIALGWMLLTNRFTLESFILGFVIAVPIVILLRRPNGNKRNITLNPMAAAIYLGQTLWGMLLSDIDVARRILNGGNGKIKPEVIRLPVGSDKEIIAALSAHAISVQPGSYVMEYEDDGQTMVVHLLDSDLRETVETQQAQRAQLAERMLGG